MKKTLFSSSSRPFFCVAALVFLSVAATLPVSAQPLLRITEVMSNGDIEDWFEVTNYGDTAIDISGFTMDDNSYNFGTSVALDGISLIAPGESVIFLLKGNDLIGDGTKVDLFRGNWGLDSSVQIGWYADSGTGFGSGGDGVTLFNDLGAELSGPFAGRIRVSFGSATSGTTFYWSYTDTGDSVATAQLSASGQNGAYTSTGSRVGSPGSALVAPDGNLVWLGGSGTWVAAGGTSWSGGAWNPAKTAVFNSGSGLVTLATSQSSSGLKFETDGYTLGGAAGVTLSAPVIEVTDASHTATVGVALVGTNGLTKNGEGTLVLSNPDNSYTGTTSVTAGTLRAGADDVIPDASVIAVSRFNTFDFDGHKDTVGGLQGLGNIINFGESLTVRITDSVDRRFDGTLSGSGDLIIDSTGSGKQIFATTPQTDADLAVKNYTGKTIIREGILEVATSAVPNATSALEIESGGTLLLRTNGGRYVFGYDNATEVRLLGGTIAQESGESVEIENILSVEVDSEIAIATDGIPRVLADDNETVRLSGALVGSSSAVLRLTASNPGVDTGRVVFSSFTNNTFSGSVDVGHSVDAAFDGDYSATAVVVQAGGRLSGQGKVGVISGAGTVGPGASPGILTGTQIDPSGGLDFDFEFTALGGPDFASPFASVNDVLRLTDPIPFASALTSANTIKFYLGLTALNEGDVFQGGFFTDEDSDFLGLLADASFEFYLLGDGLGTDASLNGQGYYAASSLAPGLSFELGTVSVLADFDGPGGDDAFNGRVLQVTAIPEPSSALLAGAALLVTSWMRRRRRS